jgi:hypothetical protein
MFRQLRICMVWIRLGMGKHCIAVLETTGKGKSFGALARAIVYTMYILGRSFVHGFYPIAVQKIVIEMLKNLNDPRSATTARNRDHPTTSAKTCILKLRSREPQSSGGRVSHGRVPHRVASYRRAPHGRASHGIHFMGMHFIGVHFTGMCLMGVYLMRASHRHVPHRLASHERVPHGVYPMACILQACISWLCTS